MDVTVGDVTPAARVRALFAGSRDIFRAVIRDPENVPERLTLLAVQRLAEPCRAWAAAAPVATDGRDAVAEQLRQQSVRIARIDGAVSGTPFLIALVPGYLGYLWQMATMVLRTGALYGRDPGDLRTAAELLVLRGIHPDVDSAHRALLAVQATSMPERPEHRRPVKTWVRSIRMILVFGGFLAPPDRSAKPDQSRIRVAITAAVGVGMVAAVWIITWVFPITFMIAMAWSCERDARDLGRRTQIVFAGHAASRRRASDRDRTVRTILRSAALAVSIAVPIAFVAFAVHEENRSRLSWVVALGALVALSVVIATAVSSRRS